MLRKLNSEIRLSNRTHEKRNKDHSWLFIWDMGDSCMTCCLLYSTMILLGSWSLKRGQLSHGGGEVVKTGIVLSKGMRGGEGG